MGLTELLSNGIRAATFRAALALPLMYGCGDTINNYYGGDGGNKKYTCEDACKNITQVCKPPEEVCSDRPEGSSCYEDNSYDSCLTDCETEPWPQVVIDCWSKECDGYYCH